MTPGQRGIVILGTIAAVALVGAAGLVAPVAFTYRAIPVSDKGSAYTLGVRHALTSDHVQEIWKGRAPQIRFRHRVRDPANKYVWQPAKLVRSGNCLDLVGDDGAPRTLPEACHAPDKIVEENNHFYFKVDEAGAINLRVVSKPPGDGSMEGHGAMFAVEGQIAVGHTFESAAFFTIEVDATALDPEDVKSTGETAGLSEPPDTRESMGAEDCGPPRLVRLHSPVVLSALPSVPAQLCRYRAKDGKMLALAQYPRGSLQLARWSDVVMCRALLMELLPESVPAEVAGCVGAHWHEREKTATSVVLFDRTRPGVLALLR
jgi:hypothetical protein